MIDLIYFLDRPKEISDKVELVGQENLDKALQEGKGVVMLSAHYGNFILMYLKSVLAGYPTNVIMRRVRDPKWEEYISNFRDVYKYLNQLKISSSINSPQQCANSIIFKKNMKKVKKMKYLGTTILKKTLNELDKSIHNEI